MYRQNAGKRRSYRKSKKRISKRHRRVSKTSSKVNRARASRRRSRCNRRTSKKSCKRKSRGKKICSWVKSSKKRKSNKGYCRQSGGSLSIEERQSIIDKCLQIYNEIFKLVYAEYKFGNKNIFRIILFTDPNINSYLQQLNRIGSAQRKELKKYAINNIINIGTTSARTARKNKMKTLSDANNLSEEEIYQIAKKMTGKFISLIKDIYRIDIPITKIGLEVIIDEIKRRLSKYFSEKFNITIGVGDTLDSFIKRYEKTINRLNSLIENGASPKILQSYIDSFKRLNAGLSGIATEAKEGLTSNKKGWIDTNRDRFIPLKNRNIELKNQQDKLNPRPKGQTQP